MTSMTSRTLYHDRTEATIRIRKAISKSPVKPSVTSKDQLSSSKTMKNLSSNSQNRSQNFFNPVQNIEKISAELFEAKCKDLQIFPQQDHEKRFTSIFINNFTERKLNLQDHKVSTATCEVLVKFLQRSNLAHVNLSRNRLTDRSLISIVKSLLPNLSLVTLDLSSTDLSPSGSDELLELLSKHRSLYSLNLSSHQFLYRNKIGSSDSLIKLVKSETLTFLNLSGTSLGNEGLKCLILGLENNQVLHYLNLSNNNIKGAVIKEFSQALVTTKIAELDLSSNQIEEVAGEELSCLLLGVYGYSELTKLNLSHNQLTHPSAYKILEAMVKENYLEHLNLERNNLAGYLEVIERFLQFNKRLKSLNLANCSLKTDTFSQICNGLAQNTALQVIILNNNQCRDSGAVAMAKALLVNGTLEKLDLSCNKIHSIGGVALANALKTNKSLKVLQLTDNELKDEVGEAFFYIFGVNYSLVSLLLHLNPMSAKYPLDIKKYLDRNRVQQEKKALQRIIESRSRKVEALISPDDLQSRMNERLAEKQTLEKKIGSYMRRLSGIKKEHDDKLEELQEKVKQLKATNVSLSKTLNELNIELRVRLIQQSSFSDERKVDELEVKMTEVDKDLKTLSETRELYLGKLLLISVTERKNKFLQVQEELNSQLEHEGQARGYMKRHLEFLQKQLQDKKFLVSGQSRSAVKTPTRTPSKYLSSEKLRRITKSKSPTLRTSAMSTLITSKV